MDRNPALEQNLIEGILSSRKYRDLDLPHETLLDLIQEAAPLAKNKAELKHRVREKLHQVIAPYLEDIDYKAELCRLETLIASRSRIGEVKTWAQGLLARHASTRERLPLQSEFYKTIFSHNGTPQSILDLACAINPLSLPWMDLPPATKYYAYDLHQPRLNLLAAFFKAYYPQAQAIQQDILVLPPAQSADLGFFFKEAHRFEKRQPGCNRAFFASLPVRTLVVSLPAEDLAGHHSLQAYHDHLIEAAISGQNWNVEKAQVGNELLYFIDKS